jgi:hypothetical protein
MRQDNQTSRETGKRDQGALHKPGRNESKALSPVTSSYSSQKRPRWDYEVKGDSEIMQTRFGLGHAARLTFAIKKERHHSRINARHHCPGQRDHIACPKNPLLVRLRSSSQCLRTENSCEVALHNRSIYILPGEPATSVNFLSTQRVQILSLGTKLTYTRAILGTAHTSRSGFQPLRLRAYVYLTDPVGRCSTPFNP